jgi:hypothetical protein
MTRRQRPKDALCALPATASAATTVGQVDPSASPSGYCTGNSGWVQSAQSGAGTYVVPAGGGVITSWSHKANSNAGKQIALRVYRATASSAPVVKSSSAARYSSP